MLIFDRVIFLLETIKDRIQKILDRVLKPFRIRSFNGIIPLLEVSALQGSSVKKQRLFSAPAIKQKIKGGQAPLKYY